MIPRSVPPSGKGAQFNRYYQFCKREVKVPKKRKRKRKTATMEGEAPGMIEVCCPVSAESVGDVSAFGGELSGYVSEKK